MVGENVLDQLIERSSDTKYGQANERRHYVPYARKGFTAGLLRRAERHGVVLHTPKSMLRAVGSRSRRA
jgi:hypothetical protein